MAYDDIITAAAKQYHLDPNLIRAVIRTESNWDPNAVREEPQINDRSLGLMQVLVGTARMVSGNPRLTETQIKQPALNVLIGSKYLSDQLGKYGFDPGISAYNAGKPLYSILPTRTFANQSYVDRVKRNLAYYQRGYIGIISVIGFGAIGFIMLRPARSR